MASSISTYDSNTESSPEPSENEEDTTESCDDMPITPITKSVSPACKDDTSDISPMNSSDDKSNKVTHKTPKTKSSFPSVFQRTKAKLATSFFSPKNLFTSSKTKASSCADIENGFIKSDTYHVDGNQKRSPKKTKIFLKMLKASEEMEDNLYSQMNKNVILKEQIKKIEFSKKQIVAERAKAINDILKMNEENQMKISNELEEITTSMEKLRLENLGFTGEIHAIKWDIEKYEMIQTNYRSMLTFRKECTMSLLDYHSRVLSSKLKILGTRKWNSQSLKFDGFMNYLGRSMNANMQAQAIKGLGCDIQRFNLKLQSVKLENDIVQKQLTEIEKSLIQYKETFSADNDNTQNISHLVREYLFNSIENISTTRSTGTN